jgi:hypothetical protein
VNGYSLKTASGEMLPILGQVNLAVQLGGQSFSHQFLVADIIDNCILGLDFMQSYGLSVDIGGGTLKYKDMEFPLLGDVDDGGVTRRVLLAEDVYIPAQS